MPEPSAADSPARLGLALAAIARTDILLVALDFDGTLAPLVDDPGQARAIPRARDAVLQLIELPDTRVALISGRAMASLIQVSALPETVLLSGSHGVEVRLDAEPTLTLDPGELASVATLKEALESVAARYDNVWLESKPAGCALHSRLASAADARASSLDALAAVEQLGATARLGAITIRRGSDVLEFSVRSTNKGDAVRRLSEHVGATAVFFAGDDVTDEDAFAALGPDDLTLKCGPGQTRANFRVGTPDEVASVLLALAQKRSAEVSA